MEKLERDIILIVGLNSTGRTTACIFLATAAEIAGLPYDKNVYMDGSAMIDAIRHDDLTGGQGHYHPWSTPHEEHTHVDQSALTPFVVTDNAIVHEAWTNFFHTLSKLERNYRYKFAVAGFGENMLPMDHPSARLDCSMERLVQMVNEGSLPSAWLDRLYAVIHVYTTSVVRYVLNEKKHPMSDALLSFHYESHKKSGEVLQIYGKDDFCRHAEIFQEHTVPFVISVQNTGASEYFESLTRIGMTLFSSRLHSKDTIKNVIILAPSGTGKTTFIQHISSLLQQYGYINAVTVSDKKLLEQTVLADLKDTIPDMYGVRRGEHGQIFPQAADGSWRIDCFDGYYLNQVHAQMIEMLQNAGTSLPVLMEYTTGRDVYFMPSKEALFQHQRHLLRHLLSKNLLSHTILLELDSPFERRLARHKRKIMPFDESVFASVFADYKGLDLLEREELINNYRCFTNPAMDSGDYPYFVSAIFYNFLLPRLPSLDQDPAHP